MVMLPGSVVCVPALSVTATVNVKVPAAVGVPESPAGALESSFTPGVESTEIEHGRARMAACSRTFGPSCGGLGA